MKKEIIFTKNAPAPIGPYNQAIKTKDTLYVSGQIAINPINEELEIDNIENETKLVLNNLINIVKAAGLEVENIVKTTIFISDMNNFKKINDIYSSFFKTNYPTRETVEVSVLPKNVNVEISCIAIF